MCPADPGRPFPAQAALLEPGMTALVQPGVDNPAILIVASTNVITATGSEEPTHPRPTIIRR